MMYSVLLVLALAAQGYARPNCFFACDYPTPQMQLPVQPSFPAPSAGYAQYPSAPSNYAQYPSAPSGNYAQYPSAVEVFRPSGGYAQPQHVETFQPSSAGSHVTFNHESQASQKTSISGTYHYPAPQPPISEPIRYQPVQQRPCRIMTDCS